MNTAANSRPWKLLWEALFSRKWAVVLAVSCTLLSAAFSLAIPLVINTSMDALRDAGGASLLLWVAVLGVGSAVAKGASSFLVLRCGIVRFRSAAPYDLGNSSLTDGGVRSEKHGGHLARVSSDATIIRAAVSGGGLPECSTLRGAN